MFKMLMNNLKIINTIIIIINIITKNNITYCSNRISPDNDDNDNLVINHWLITQSYNQSINQVRNIEWIFTK